MAAIIVFNSGDETSVHFSKLDPHGAAKKIKDHFHLLSSDDEKTSIETRTDETLPHGFLTVVLTNEYADDGSGPDHDLAHILEFTAENMAWAMAQADDPTGHAETLRESGAL